MATDKHHVDLDYVVWTKKPIQKADRSTTVYVETNLGEAEAERLAVEGLQEQVGKLLVEISGVYYRGKVEPEDADENR